MDRLTEWLSVFEEKTKEWGQVFQPLFQDFAQFFKGLGEAMKPTFETFVSKVTQLGPKMSQAFQGWLERLWQRKEWLIVGSLIVVLVTLVLVVIAPESQKKIRVSQTNSLIAKEYGNKKQVKILADGELEETIRKNQEAVVILADPSDRYYDNFVKSISDSELMADFNQKVYVYPIIYQDKQIKKFYQLTSGLTMIHFEHKREQKRITLNSQKEIELYLVNHLNLLVTD